MSYKTYDDYIESKIYLMDEIPSHWDFVQMNHFIEYVTDYVANGSFASLRENVKYLDEEDYAILVRLVDNSNNFSGPFVYIDEDAYNFLSKSKLFEGDIVISNIGAVGSLFKVPDLGKPMSLAPNSLLVRFENSTLANYFYYWFSSDIGLQFLNTIVTTTTQPKFNKTDFRKLLILNPPLDEQEEIVNFLDKKISQINNNIYKNKELISLLDEKKVALINRAVTKGLDSSVCMKDSGIEWIGEIPKHWDFIKISRVFDNIGSGTTPKSSVEEYYIDGDINWLITGDLNDSNIYETSTKITKKAKIEIPSLKTYPKDSLVIAMYGATIGKLGILKIETCTNQACCVLSNSKIMDIKYAFYWFLSFKKDIISMSYGGGQPNISQDIIKNLKIIVPPLNVQKEIVDYLDMENSKIDKTIKKIEYQIGLLEEYKVSLIHHVVTGKIDVRDEI